MTQDEIIRMAREAGFTELAINFADNMRDLERFFNLAFAAGAALEREACAQKMERIAPDTPSLAAAIRARGKSK